MTTLPGSVGAGRPAEVTVPAGPRRGVAGSVLRYGLIGLASFAIDLGSLHLGYRWWGLPLWAAASGGFWLSFTVNFLANKYWTFQAVHGTYGQLRRYAALVVANYAATLVILTVLDSLGVHHLLAKTLSVAVLTLTTFVLLRAWVFSQERDRGQ